MTDTNIDPDACHMTSWSNQKIYFDKPWLYTVTQLDIVRYGIGQRRYNGGIDWSIMQHHALCLELARVFFNESPDLKIIEGYVAVHDEHEGVVGDMTSGLKKFCPGFKEIEVLWERHFHNSQGLWYKYRPLKEVKWIDMRALELEMHYLEHPRLNHKNTTLEKVPISQTEIEIMDSLTSTPQDELYYRERGLLEAKQETRLLLERRK